MKRLNDKADITIADSLFWALWYEGCDERVETMLRALEAGEPEIDSLLGGAIDIDNEPFMRMFWAILVQQYGNYGVSPCSGWIEDKEAAAKFIREQLNRTWRKGSSGQ